MIDFRGMVLSTKNRYYGCKVSQVSLDRLVTCAGRSGSSFKAGYERNINSFLLVWIS